MKYSSLEILRVVKINMESKYLVNLHIALENEFPIPEDTLIALVRNQFSLDNWYPSEDDGFILIDEENDMFDDEIIHYYVDQTQEFYLNARGMLDETESSEMSDNQQQFKEFRDNEAIEKIQQELNLIRLDYISLSDNRDFSANSYVDAWININNHIGEDKLAILKQASFDLMTSDDYKKELTEKHKFEVIFAFDTLIEKEPKGPIATYKASNYGDKESTNSSGIEVMNVESECHFKIVHLEKILNLCIEELEPTSEIIKLILAIEHMKTRMSFGSLNIIDLNDEETLQIIEDRINHYFNNTEDCRTKNELTRNHIKDIMILSIIKGKAIERYGVNDIINKFDSLIELNVKDKKYCQSIEFIRDNYCLDGKERIDSLVKHEVNTHSKFQNGLINYLIGASLELDHKERIPRLLKAMDIFYGADTLRFESCLKVLVGGYFDTKDNNGNPSRYTTLKQEDDIQTISRITNIISQLDHTNSAITYMVVWDIHDYLVARITRHLARCGSCDYPHIYINKWELYASIEQISELEKAINRLLDNSPNDEIKNNLLGLIECAYMMKVSLLGMRINFDSDEFIHETTNYTNELVKNPVNVTVSRYNFSTFKTERIYEDIGSLIMHLSELIFTEGEKVESLKKINQFTAQELDDTDDVNRKGVLRLATKCFNKMLEVDSSKWMQVFASISLVELDEQLMKVPNLSESEFDKILTIAKHAHSIGIYDSITKNSEAEEEHSDAIFEIIQQIVGLDGFEQLQSAQEYENLEELVTQIESVVYPIVKNPYISLIQDVSNRWSSETRPHFRLLNLVIRVFKDVEKLLIHHETDELTADQFDLGLATIMSKHSPEMMHLMMLTTGEDFSDAVD
tara:strand:- start:3258 stop:5831 length:2574 start_codon:yes stop_codon:yes gene_type:complete